MRRAFERPVLLVELMLRRTGRLPAALVVASACLAVWSLGAAINARSAAAAAAAEQVQRAAQAAAGAPQRADAAGARVASAQRLADFYRALGQDRDTESYLRQLYQSMQRAGLQFSHVDYRRTDQAASRTARLTIDLTVLGTYASVRDFVGDAQAKLPFLAIDALEFRREGVGSVDGEASLRLTLHLRSAEVLP